MKLESGHRAGGTPSGRGERPIVMELAGPAGSGKTTLRKELLQREPDIHFLELLDRPRTALGYLRASIPLVPTYAMKHRGTRWFTRPEGKALGLLEGWRRPVGAAARAGRTVLMDQGPVFRLAVLSEMGPPLTRSRAFDRRLDGWSAAWGRLLDLIILLTASDEVLLRRIRTRPQDHAVKQWADEPALERVRRYEAAIGSVVEGMAAQYGVEVLRLDSSTTSPSALADAVQDAVEGTWGGDG